MATYLLDTNILLRSVKADGSLHHRQAVDAIVSTVLCGDQVFITPQNIVEFWSVGSRASEANGLGWTPKQVHIEIERMLKQFTLLDDVPEIFSSWLELTTRYHVIGRRVHDARLVAVMVVHGITHLLTFNGKDFKQFSEISVADPAQMLQ